MDREDVISRYCEAWNEVEANHRRDALADVFEQAGTYTDPTVHLDGPDALVAHIGSVLERLPGSRIERIGPAQIHHDVARFSFRRLLADGSTARQGVDFVAFAASGKLASIVGFFD